MHKIGWSDYLQDVRTLMGKIRVGEYDCILTIARGGTILGTILSHKLKIPMAVIISESYTKEHEQKEVRLTKIIMPPSLEDQVDCTLMPVKCLIADDLLDTGKTIEAIKSVHKDWSFDIAVLYHKGKCSPPEYWVKEINDWIEFPYEDS